MASPKNHKVDKEMCRIISPEFRVSHPHLFKPQQVKPTDKPKFSVTMLYPKDSDLMGYAPALPGDEPVKRSLKEVIKNAKLAEFGPKENWPEELESPVADGDSPKYKDKEGYKGHWVIKATANEDSKPYVVGPTADEYGKFVPITTPSELYPGCYARAYLYAYVWEYMGKRGVGFIVDGVQKIRDGKSFGGKKSAEQVFTSVGPASDESADDEDDMDFG